MSNDPSKNPPTVEELDKKIKKLEGRCDGLGATQMEMVRELDRLKNVLKKHGLLKD